LASRLIDGKAEKLSKIVKPDGRTLIVAFDHGLTGGPVPGSENVAKVLRQIVDGGADAVLVNPGVFKKFRSILTAKISAIMSLPLDPLFVKHAAESGADGVKTTYFGDVFDSASTKKHQEVAMECEKHSIPYLAEIVPASENTREDGARSYIINNDKWLVKVAARKAAEAGADIVKTCFTGSVESFSEVVGSTFIPVVILGGEKSTNDVVLQTTTVALRAGAAGVAYGRNIWKNENPKEMIKSLRQVIHPQVHS
jgi:fructose-bisphosphate aldolase / 2-amino-3,7-dideoxy-D-threo-hept-6-ulosonate synthase